MEACKGCGKPRDPGRRYCKKCYSEIRKSQAKRRYAEKGRHLYAKTCEACKTDYKSCSKTSRVCHECLAESKSFSSVSNSYEYEWGEDKNIWRHRRIAEQAMNRRLDRDEVVHHMDENPKNNALSNLIIMSRKDHGSLHALLRIERVIFEKSKNENPVNCWDTLRDRITTAWLETTSATVIRISCIG